MDYDLVRRYSRHAFLGVAHLYAARIAHRDLSLGNLLVSLRENVVKVSDLGMSASADKHVLECLVSTACYRAPEVILSRYSEKRVGSAGDHAVPLGSSPVGMDLWSMGCVVVSLLTGSFLFDVAEKAGRDPSFELLKLHGRFLGAPTEKSWPGVTEWPGWEGLGGPRLPRHPAQPPAVSLRNAACVRRPFPPDASVDLALGLLQWNPDQRTSAAAAAKHPSVQDARPSEGHVHHEVMGLLRQILELATSNAERSLTQSPSTLETPLQKRTTASSSSAGASETAPVLPVRLQPHGTCKNLTLSVLDSSAGASGAALVLFQPHGTSKIVTATAPDSSAGASNTRVVPEKPEKQHCTCKGQCGNRSCKRNSRTPGMPVCLGSVVPGSVVCARCKCERHEAHPHLLPVVLEVRQRAPGGLLDAATVRESPRHLAVRRRLGLALALRGSALVGLARHCPMRHCRFPGGRDVLCRWASCVGGAGFLESLERRVDEVAACLQGVGVRLFSRHPERGS